MMSGTVVGLYTAPRARAPMDSHDAVEVVAGVGIPGDRYATGLGHWSDPRWPDQELTLVEAEVADDVGLPANQLRRNIVTRGVRLDDLIGTTFKIGDAVLQGIRPCDPCVHIQALTRPGILKALVDRGGLRAHIVTGGRIQVGDRIEAVELAKG